MRWLIPEHLTLAAPTICSKHINKRALAEQEVINKEQMCLPLPYITSSLEWNLFLLKNTFNIIQEALKWQASGLQIY